MKIFMASERLHANRLHKTVFYGLAWRKTIEKGRDTHRGSRLTVGKLSSGCTMIEVSSNGLGSTLKEWGAIGPKFKRCWRAQVRISCGIAAVGMNVL